MSKQKYDQGAYVCLHPQASKARSAWYPMVVGTLLGPSQAAQGTWQQGLDFSLQKTKLNKSL